GGSRYAAPGTIGPSDRRRARSPWPGGHVPQGRAIPLAAGARVPHQCRCAALLPLRNALLVRAATLLAGKPDRPPAGGPGAVAGGDRAADAHRATHLPVAGAFAHLPLVWKAHCDRAGNAVASL